MDEFTINEMKEMQLIFYKRNIKINGKVFLF